MIDADGARSGGWTSEKLGQLGEVRAGDEIEMMTDAPSQSRRRLSPPAARTELWKGPSLRLLWDHNHHNHHQLYRTRLLSAATLLTEVY